MGTVYLRYHWLLWTLLIMLLKQEVSGRVCPQLQLLQVHKRGDYVTCCYPTRCGVGEEVVACVENGTQDTCLPCSDTQNQSSKTSSFTMERCTDWPLNKECRDVSNPGTKRNIYNEQTKLCMCNIEQGKRFDPPEIENPGASMDTYCQRRHDPCQPGYEPQVDGGCKPCKENYFNSIEGYSLCQPATNCILLGLKFTFRSNRTSDSICSKPDPIVTAKPSITYKPYLLTTTVQSRTTLKVISQKSTTPSETTGNSHVEHVRTTSASLARQNNDIIWPIVGSLLGGLLIIVSIGLVLFCCRRRGMSIFACANRNSTGAEENHVEVFISSEPRNHLVKHSMDNGGSVMSGNLTNANKVRSNGSNGDVLPGIEDLTNGHIYDDNPHGHFIQTDYQNGGTLQYSNPNSHYSVAEHRPGVLRTDSRNIMFGQRQANLVGLTVDRLDDVGDGLEANPNLDETDCLLVSRHSRRVASPHIPNLATSVDDSPTVTKILTGNGNRKPNCGQLFVKNVHFSQSVLPDRATYIPAADTVKFTRSVSLIASPEGEVDEGKEETRFPRFSQLLQDNEDSYNADSALDYSMPSPTNQQVPSVLPKSQRDIPITQQHYHQGNQALLQQVPSVLPKSQRDTPVTQQHYHQGNQPLLQQVPSVLLKSQRDTPVTQQQMPSGVPKSQRDTQITPTNHHIMNLKEQELIEPTELSSSGSETFVKTVMGQRLTTIPSSVISEDTYQQTKLKTASSSPTADKFSNISSNITHKKNINSFEDIHLKQKNNEEISHKLADRNRHKSAGMNLACNNEKKQIDIPNFSTQDQVSSRDSNRHNSSEQQQQYTDRSNHHRPRIEATSSEESDTTMARRQQYHRLVSFEDNNNVVIANKRCLDKTDQLQSSRSQNSPITVTTSSELRAPLRALSDLEQGPNSSSEIEETEGKQLYHNVARSNTSSKTSVNSELSQASDGSNNPNTASMKYRRSQSHSAPSSCDSSHKPPPRSMSEEKPQKLDRPVAKVKPMPASENCANQQPSDDIDRTTQQFVQTNTANNNNTASIFTSNSQDSHQEAGMEVGQRSDLQEEEQEEEDRRTNQDLVNTII